MTHDGTAGSGFIARIDISGNTTWMHQTDSDYRSCRVADDGSIVGVGFYQPLEDFGGGTLPFPTLFTGFILKLDALGNHVYSRSFVWPEALAHKILLELMSDGTAVLAGQTYKDTNFGDGDLYETDGPFIAIFEPDGSVRISRQLGGGSIDGASIDADDTLLITGEHDSPLDIDGLTANGPDSEDGRVYVMRMNGHAQPSYLESYDHGSHAAIAATPSGAAVTGFLEHNDAFGGPVLAGSGEGFVAEFSVD